MMFLFPENLVQSDTVQNFMLFMTFILYVCYLTNFMQRCYFSFLSKSL